MKETKHLTHIVIESQQDKMDFLSTKTYLNPDLQIEIDSFENQLKSNGFTIISKEEKPDGIYYNLDSLDNVFDSARRLALILGM